MQAQIISNYILRVGLFTIDNFLFSPQLIPRRPPRPQEDIQNVRNSHLKRAATLSETANKRDEQEICRLLLTMALQNSFKEHVSLESIFQTVQSSIQ